MESRGNRLQLMVGGDDFTHQVLGKDPKIFRRVRGQVWEADRVLSLFEAVKRLPGMSGQLHGCRISVVTPEEASQLQVGDLLLQIMGDRHDNVALRKNVLQVKSVMAGEDVNSSIYQTAKVWPVSVDWAFDSLHSPRDLYDPAYRHAFGHFPVLYFRFKVTNADCYEYRGDKRYELAAARAREFMALAECYKLALGRSTQVNALEADFVDGFYVGGQDFRRVYYVLRSVLLDRTLQGFGGIYRDSKTPKLDLISPLLSQIQGRAIQEIGNRASETTGFGREEKDAPIFKVILNPDAGSSTVAERLRALFNPAYCADRAYWPLFNRWGLMKCLAKNLSAASLEATALQKMFAANHPMFGQEIQGLAPDHLNRYFME